MTTPLCQITDCTMPTDDGACEAHPTATALAELIERQRYHVSFIGPDASSSDGEFAPDRWPVDAPSEKFNAFSSEIVGSSDLHAPVLDIDFEARLVPSSTPGHYHLYLDKAVEWDAYERFLRAAADAGILQEGYVNASIERRATFVRKPGVKK